MANTRRTTSNSPFAVGLFVLLVTLGVSWPSSAHTMSLESASQFNLARRNLRSSQYEGLAVDMMHIDHVDSPYANPQLPMAERMKAAVERSRARARFLQSKRTSPDVSIPEYHGQADYLVNFSLGTPPQSFRGLADTGSDLLWVQCTNDSLLFSEPDPLFDPSQSSSYKLVNCSSKSIHSHQYCTACSQEGTCLFELTYGDNSTTEGNLASETLTLGRGSASEQSFPGFEFGCAQFANGSNDGDGLVGLSRGNDSLVSQLGFQILSFCLTDFTQATNKTSSLLLGSAGPLPLSYTPLLSTHPPYFYYVNVTGISVNGMSIDYPADAFEGALILDSGSTFTSLDSRAYTPLQNRLASLITYPSVEDPSGQFDLCYDVANPSFPSVSFHFQGGLEVALPSDNLFMVVDGGYYCLAIQSAEEDSGSILGNVQMQNFQIAFDIAEERVGFASTKC